IRYLLPYATVRPGALVRNVAQQEYLLRYHQLGLTAGGGERRIEHRDAEGQRSLPVQLVGPDAEAADRLQPLCCGQYRGVELGAGAQPDEVSVANLFDQLFFRERGLQIVDVGISCGGERVDGALVQAFEKQELDLALFE